LDKFAELGSYFDCNRFSREGMLTP
jgi:hypothetical protein